MILPLLKIKYLVSSSDRSVNGALCNDLLGKSELLMMAEIIASQRASPLIITNHRSSFVSTQHGALKYRCVS